MEMSECSYEVFMVYRFVRGAMFCSMDMNWADMMGGMGYAGKFQKQIGQLGTIGGVFFWKVWK
jgi:hypothetical protein